MVGFTAGSRVEVPGKNPFIKEDSGDDNIKHRGFSPPANYTYRATVACRRS
jgi:hypothetical protein